MTVKKIALATSQRRNKAMTMHFPVSVAAPALNANYIRRAPPTLIQVSRVFNDSEPTLQRHPFAPAGSNRHQSMIAQPINHSGRWIAIPEECKIPQKAQIAPRKPLSTEYRADDARDIFCPPSQLAVVSYPQP
jgi:hypothetical protein